MASHLPGLSPVFVTLLALWSLGMILARRCGLDSVACQLVRLLGQSDDTTRQRLRAFYQEAAAKAGAKRGAKRRDFDVTTCFAPLLRWVLSFWSCPRLALALDVTKRAERLWLALAVTLLWLVVLGATVEGAERKETLGEIGATESRLRKAA